MDSKKIGQFIAIQRKQLFMTQQNLADKLDITNKAVSKWETGEGYPDITVLPALAEVLEVTVDEILNGEKNNSNPIVDNPFSIKESKQQADYILEKRFQHFNNNYLISIGILCIGIIGSTLALKLYHFMTSELIYSIMISISFMIIGFMFYNNICKWIKSDIEKYNSLIDRKKVDFCEIIYIKHILFYAIYTVQVVILTYIIPLYPYRNMGYYDAFKKLYGYTNIGSSPIRTFVIDYDYYRKMGILVYLILVLVGILVITINKIISKRKTEQNPEESL